MFSASPLGPEGSNIDRNVDRLKGALRQTAGRVQKITKTVMDIPDDTITWIMKSLQSIMSHLAVVCWWIVRIMLILSAICIVFAFWATVYTAIHSYMIPDDIQSFPVHFDYHHLYRTYAESYNNRNIVTQIHQNAPLISKMSSTSSKSKYNQPYENLRVYSDPQKAFFGQESAQAVIPLAFAEEALISIPSDDSASKVNFISADYTLHNTLSDDGPSPVVKSKMAASGFHVDICFKAFIPTFAPSPHYSSPEMTGNSLLDVNNQFHRWKPQWQGPVMLTLELYDKNNHVIHSSVRPLAPPPQLSWLHRAAREIVYFLPNALLGWEEGSFHSVEMFDRMPIPDIEDAPRVALLSVSPPLTMRTPTVAFVTRLSGLKRIMREHPLVCGTLFAAFMTVSTLVAIISLGVFLYAVLCSNNTENNNSINNNNVTKSLTHSDPTTRNRRKIVVPSSSNNTEQFPNNIKVESGKHSHRPLSAPKVFYDASPSNTMTNKTSQSLSLLNNNSEVKYPHLNPPVLSSSGDWELNPNKTQKVVKTEPLTAELESLSSDLADVRTGLRKSRRRRKRKLNYSGFEAEDGSNAFNNDKNMDINNRDVNLSLMQNGVLEDEEEIMVSDSGGLSEEEEEDEEEEEIKEEIIENDERESNLKLQAENNLRRRAVKSQNELMQDEEAGFDILTSAVFVEKNQ